LFGSWQSKGWYGYYLVALLLKEPLPFWILVAVGLATYSSKWKPISSFEFNLIWPGLLLFLFVSSQNGFSHHPRYVLPVLPPLMLIASRSFLLKKSCRVISTVMFMWIALSVALVYPRTYAYFSDIVGGPYEGWRYLGDSGLDWGQDLKTLHRWMERNPEVEPVTMAYAPQFLEHNYSGYSTLPPIFKKNASDDLIPARTGTWAVFGFCYVRPEYKWFREHDPVARPSPTLWIFTVTEQDIAEVNIAEKVIVDSDQDRAQVP